MTNNPYIKAAEQFESKSKFELATEALNKFDFLNSVEELMQDLQGSNYLEDYSISERQKTVVIIFCAPNDHRISIKLGINKKGFPTIEYDEHNGPITRKQTDVHKVQTGRMSADQFNRKHSANEDPKIRQHILSMMTLEGLNFRRGTNGGAKLDVSDSKIMNLALTGLANFIMTMPKSMRPTRSLDLKDSKYPIRHFTAK